MFFVFNKSKICSYLVSVGTVVVLLVMGFYISNNDETISTSSNSIENNVNEKVENNINNSIIK